MAQEITLTMEGTLLNWLKNVGDSVNSGEVIAEIDADKATVEVEAPGSGVLLEQRAKTGDELSEGAVIGVIGEAGEGSAPEASQAAPGAEPERQAEVAQQQGAEPATNGKTETRATSNGAQQQAASTTEDGRIKASPLARRIAEERGVDLNQVTGSGPGGRIVREDVENFTPGAAPARPTETPAAAPSTGPILTISPTRKAPAESGELEYIEVSTMRKRIAAGTVESKQFTPHFYVTVDIDVEAMLALRKQLNDNLPEGGAKITVNDLVVKATALTLRDFPNLNSHYYGDKIVRYNNINVAMAVAIPGGVIYVVAQNADQVALGTLAANNKAMFERVREGKIKPADIQGATFSTSNLGSFGVENFIAIINPPESGVLAISTAQKVPVVKEDGTLGVGSRMKVTISADHRVSDGAEAAEFLKVLKELIENPLRLVM